MANHLTQETSPYLLQHANNPVDWYPWGEAALRLARAQNKPILLSIGYSACHWCHVMAHESFEDAEVAALMNENFINIKVDREERPDLDHIYQAAHALITGRPGGWPLTMFLTPQQQPFFGGTYFPRTARYQLPGFAELLQRVAHFYRTEQAQIASQGASLLQALNQAPNAAQAQPGSGEITAQPLNAAMHEMAKHFDRQHGGFGAAPKFPCPADLDLCLRVGDSTGDRDLKHMALHTLERMAQGGVFDQLGGGFFRYSVDQRWEIPHFEKMLYDNAQLLPLYADAWVLTKNPLFQQVAAQTAAWVMREMQAPEGGYFSSQDADSEHEEGKFYVWSQEAMQGTLDAPEYAVSRLYYGLDGQANFDGKWHLRVARTLAEVAQQLGRSADDCATLLAAARAKLRAAREQRVRPGRDEKILTAWNGLMINGMAHAARVFGRDDWLRSARDANRFVREALWRNGRMQPVHKDGRSHLNAYLDDYAFMLEAQLELLQAAFDAEALHWAVEIAEVLLAKFLDDERGDFYFTSHDHEALIQRPKPLHDSATPSGNAVAARALLRLGHLIGETHYVAAAERALHSAYPELARHPAGFASMLGVLREVLVPLPVLILCGKAASLQGWLAALRDIYGARVFSVALTESHPGLPQTLRKPVSQKASAWLCRGTQCYPAIEDIAGLRAALREKI